jgi:uncharacterized protein (UPF0276 family)
MYPKPYLGFGLGLRPPHYTEILANEPKVDWFEILTENYLVPGGKPLYYLDQIQARYPIVMHGVSLSIGSASPIDLPYLNQVAALAKRVNAYWISDHLCWTGLKPLNMHDLLPIPYTLEAVKHIAQKIIQVQEVLGQRILIENVSSYLSYTHSEMSEWEFLTEVVTRADCGILLDINNIYVSAFNHGFDPMTYLNAIPIQRVQQIHLAGHRHFDTHIIDTHDQPVIASVWELYAKAIQRFGAISTMIERDDNIPPFLELVAELNIAKHIAHANLPQYEISE